MQNKLIKILNPLSELLELDFDKTTLLERAEKRYNYIVEKRSNGYLGMFWDYLEYIPGTDYSGSSKSTRPWYNKNIFISDSGDVLSISKKREKISLLTNDYHGTDYPKIRIRSKFTSNVRVHRAVASTFIPQYNPEQNEVNHIDSDRAYHIMSNLEWTTRKENLEHSFQNSGRNYQILKARWNCADEHFGKEFIIIGTQEAINLGFKSKRLGRLGKDNGYMYGCVWSRVTEYDESIVGIPEELKDKIFDKDYTMKMRLKI